MKSQLLGLIQEHGLRRGSFKMSNGKTRDLHIDISKVALAPEGHWLFGRVLFEAAIFFDRQLNAVAGVGPGGYPLASAVSYTSDLDRRLSSHLRGGKKLPLISAVYVHQNTRVGGGTGRYVEVPHGVERGSRIVLLTDIVTTGSAAIQAAKILADEGCRIVGSVTVVDQMEGGLDAIRDVLDIPVIALFTREDFVENPPSA